MIELMIWLVPPDRDPVFGALPLQLKLLCVIALALLFWAGVAMFLWGVINELERSHGQRPEETK